MKILHINTSDHGGAANACIRLHKGLRKQGVSSKILFLNLHNSADNHLHGFYTNRSKFFFKKILQRLLYRNKWRTRNLKPVIEGFFSPKTVHRIENHPLIDWADIIHLHWVTHFLNYPTFFNRVQKPIVWTLHDMNPFSGGYHYSNGFDFEGF